MVHDIGEHRPEQGQHITGEDRYAKLQDQDPGDAVGDVKESSTQDARHQDGDHVSSSFTKTCGKGGCQHHPQQVGRLTYQEIDGGHVPAGARHAVAGLHIVAEEVDGYTVADGVEEQRSQPRGHQDPPGRVSEEVLQILLHRGVLLTFYLHHPLPGPGETEQEEHHANHTDGANPHHPPHRVGAD